MSRAFKLTLAALVLAGALPAAAASQQVTEQIAGFAVVTEAPAIVLSGARPATQGVTEQIASFDSPMEAPAITLSWGEAPQQVTERIASFDQVPAIALAGAAVKVSDAKAAPASACRCDHG
jgi:hypothetical protein